MEDDEATIRRDETNHDIEDDVQDWKLLKTFGNTAKSGSASTTSAIPKRGEKEFAPDGTTVQNQALEESRDSMYEALSGIRGHNLKQKLSGVWIPENHHCLVIHAKGNYFRDVGTPVNIGRRVRGGVVLNTLETVYLVERGSLVAHLADESFHNWLYKEEDEEETPQPFDYDTLVSLDLAFLYSLAFDNSQYSLDQYQVYSYLKRHGYLIQNFKQLNPKSQQERLVIKSQAPQWSIFSILSPLLKKLPFFGVSLPISNSLHFLTNHYFNYTSVFKSLRLIRSEKSYESLQTLPPKSEDLDQYKISFNVWKPTPTFSKKNPPVPDFQVSVINTANSRFPSLYTIKTLLNTINYEFPHERKTIVEEKKTFKKKSTLPPTKRELKAQRQKERQAKLDERIQIKNKYLKERDFKLKFGSNGRNIVIATVNNGILNFVNLTEGDFTLEDNIDLDKIYPGKDHGIIFAEND